MLTRRSAGSYNIKFECSLLLEVRSGAQVVLHQEEAVNQRLAEVFREVFNDDSLELRPESTAEDVAEWDSINHVRLMLAVQEAFAVHFSASEIARLKKVGDLTDLILSKRR